jgi:hypothetical protein
MSEETTVRLPQPPGRVLMLAIYYNVMDDDWEHGSNDDLIDPEVAEHAANAAVDWLEQHLVEKAQKLAEHSEQSDA